MSKTRISKEDTYRIKDKTDWNKVLGKSQDEVDREAHLDKENSILPNGRFHRINDSKAIKKV